MRKLTVILDAAHGHDVAGKCSPCKTHHEWSWSRDICYTLAIHLHKAGYPVYFTVSQPTEPGLSYRVARAQQVPGDHRLLISLHNNAAGDGTTWNKARGVEIFTSPGQTNSDWMATEVLRHIKNWMPDVRQRTDITDGDDDKEAKFTVLMGAGYYAMLIEWLFMDNKEDLALLKDAETNENLIDAIVEALNCIDAKL